MPGKLKKLVPFFVTAGFIALTFFAWTKKWDIYDTWRLRDYQAPAAIAQLASQTTMNDSTRRLFYVYHPELSTKDSFNSRCNSAEQTIVLGCYIPNTGIYLFNIQDARLNGIQQVTAAHEALHAAYDRLGKNEKVRINALLNDAYKKISDERIRSTIDEYKNNGADVNNELHSILATEVRDLPPELEQYYTKYFNNRLAVVGFSEQYEGAFTERKKRIDEADGRLAGLKVEIESGEADLNARQEALQRDRARLDALLSSKNYEAYNAGVSNFNAQVNAYNATVRRVRSLIDQYNTIVSERNAIAEEQGELIKAIDSRPDTLETH